jgi:hypothetical protein
LREVLRIKQIVRLRISSCEVQFFSYAKHVWQKKRSDLLSFVLHRGFVGDPREKVQRPKQVGVSHLGRLRQASRSDIRHKLS